MKVGEGESSALKLSTGSLAKLADGAAVAQVRKGFSIGFYRGLFIGFYWGLLQGIL